MNLGLGSKRKRRKVVHTGYPTDLLVEKVKKVWWMAKGGEVDLSLGRKRKQSEGCWGTTQMRTNRSRFHVLT